MDRASGGPPKTTPTEFFVLCQRGNFAKTLLYMDVPRYYCCRNKSCNRRKQGKDVTGFPVVKEAHILGGVYAHCQSTSRRMLLPLVAFA